MTISDLGKKLWLWLRRLLCIFGAGATAEVILFLNAITSKRPLDALFNSMEIPFAGLAGAILGAFIVFRAERQEIKKKLEARKRCIPNREALWLEVNR
jgi:hypothetical protein